MGEEGIEEGRVEGWVVGWVMGSGDWVVEGKMGSWSKFYKVF